MNRSVAFVASVLALVSSGFLHAATEPASLPVLSVTQVEVGDPGLYAAQIAAANAVMKSKFGVDTFLRVFHADAAGDDTGSVFAVARADSFVALNKNTSAFLSDPALADIRASLATFREVKSRTMSKAIRFDGVHPGAWLYNTFAMVHDEPGYLKAIGELRALLDGHGFTDAKINVYRVIAGRSNYSHLISINLPSSDRLAAMMDAVSTESWVIDWITSSAKLRTVVHNGTFHEITR